MSKGKKEEIEILEMDKRDENQTNKKEKSKNKEKEQHTVRKQDKNKKKGKRMRSKQKKSKNKIVYMVVAILYSIFYGIGIFFLIKINVVPIKLLLFVLGLSFILSFMILFFLLKKKVRKKIKIISSVVAVLFILLYGLGSYYAYYTLNFMKNIKTDNTSYEEFYVIVRKKSQYKKIKDIKNKHVYILNAKDENYLSSQKKLQNIVSMDYKKTNNIKNIYQKFLKEEIIFVSSNIYSILSEGNYKIDEEGKILYTIKIKNKQKEIVKKVKTDKEPFNLYISGTDQYGNISSVGRSDVNMIATINPNTHKILLTSIPRDYYVKLHTKNAYDKLTHSSIYGINETIYSVEDLLDCDINYYVKVNFMTIIDLVDVIGGIEVNSPYTFTTHGMGKGKKYSFRQGVNKLNGEEALAFSRERKSFSDGDRQRVKNQQLVLSAIINKVTSSMTILTKYADILKKLQSSFQTNMSEDDMQNLVKNQLSNMTGWSIESNSLDGVGSRKTTYTYGNQTLYVMDADINSVNVAKEKIKAVLESKNS